MENDKTARILNGVGRALAADLEYPLDGTFLYAELEPQVVAASIFKDLGDRLRYRHPSDELENLLLELWDCEPAGKRWAAMIYRVEGTSFRASFIFPEEMDWKEDYMARREHALSKWCGNKRIEYPEHPFAASERWWE